MCLFPVRALTQETGRPLLNPEGDLLLPCGACYECKSKRASEWAMRCRHEIGMHDENCFITLTYDNDHLPSPLICKEYFQKFMKKLRKLTKTKLKYIVSHEYGGKTGRPHHHAIIFGWTPPSQDYLMQAPSGEPLFSSKTLDKLWEHGFHSIGEANAKTAYYIASYSLKSNSVDVTLPDSGEVISVRDTMNCSTRPAIGKEYFMKHHDSVLASEKYIPRYYIKLLERHFPEKFEEYQNNVNLNLQSRGAHDRLAKYVITEQKENLQNEGFRAAPENQRIATNYKDHLKRNRDDYKQILDKKEFL